MDDMRLGLGYTLDLDTILCRVFEAPSLQVFQTSVLLL